MDGRNLQTELIAQSFVFVMFKIPVIPQVFSPTSSVLEDGVVLLRKRKDFPHDVVLLEFESEKKVNDGSFSHQDVIYEIVHCNLVITTHVMDY